jgi:hypothetical protein
MDLLFFLKLTEGSFINRGYSKLIYLINVKNFKWESDTKKQPPICSEDEYWDNNLSMCSKCDNSCNHCFKPSKYGCIDCKENLPYLDSFTKTCIPICNDNTFADNKYLDNKRCSSKYIFYINQLILP